MKEIFKIIEEFPEYEVSNLGNIRSYRIYKNGKLLKHRISNGYNRVMLNKKNKMVHRLLAQAFIPNPENKPCINHINGIRNDNRVENLEWVTISENNKHAYDTGLKPPIFGENHYSTTLTKQNVIEIIKLLKTTNLFYKEIAKLFNTSISTVARLKHKKTWKHLFEEI